MAVVLGNTTEAIAHPFPNREGTRRLGNQSADVEPWVLTSWELWQLDGFYLFRAPLSQRRFLEALKI